MSAREPVTFEGGGGSVVPNDYEPPNDAPDRVTVDGVRIPSVGDGVNVEIRKEGPSDLTRYTTVQSRYEWDGNSYGDFLRTDSQRGYKGARVELRNPVTGEFETVHVGFLDTFGGDVNGNIRLSVRDPAQLLSNVPAEGGFGLDKTIADVLEYVTEQFTSQLPLYDDVIIRASSAISNRGIYDEASIGENILDITLPDIEPKTFTDKHTLQDVMDWIRDKGGFRWWFEPTPSDSVLALRVVPMETLPSLQTNHKTEELNGDIDVFTNNAEYTVQPQNSLTVVGDATRSQDAAPTTIEDFQTDLFDPAPRKAVSVTVQHDPLVERAGKQVGGRVRKERFVTEEGVRTFAVSKLKEILDEPTSGEVVTNLSPQVSPYDTLRTRPVSQNVVNEDISAITYEVESTRHSTSTNKRLPHTTHTISYYVDPTDITVTDVTWKEV